MTFARTKILPPRPRAGALIERPRLHARLRQAVAAHRLVLVSAAAGYGKTSALAALAARAAPTTPPGGAAEGAALAWIGADEGDDLHRLLECWVAALEPFDPPWRTAPEALVAQVDTPRGRARAADELVNALDACELPHGTIVFDDLHRVEDGVFFELLDRVLERLSARWTLVLSTRHDPPLSLARLRASGELAEFRQADLQFDAEEVQAFAATAGAAAHAGALLERTQGWPAGLRLALSGGAGRAPAASDRVLFDFLATEVIDRLEPALRDFLVHTAVLPELTAVRAAAVSGLARAAEWLDQVDRLGLFATPLEGPEPTLKLHDLFREALLRRLDREPTALRHALWTRAAQGESDPARQVPMLLKAGDPEAAAEALAAEAPALLTDGALAGVAHLLDQFPGPFVAASAPLQSVLGLLGWARWDFAAMLESMRRAEAGFEAAGEGQRARAAVAYQAIALNALGRNEESAALLSTLRREQVAPATRVVVLVACIWHALDLGSTHRVGPMLDELVDLLERHPDPALWYRAHPLPRINGLPGTAAALERYVAGALRVAGERPLPLRALARSQAAWHHLWHEGRVDAARAALAEAQDDSRWLGDPPNVKGNLQLLAAFVHAAAGEGERACAAAQQMVDQHPSGRGAASLWAHVLYAGRIAGACGDAEGLEHHLGQLERADGSTAAPSQQLPLLLPLQGQRAWLAGDHGSAVALWRRALADEPALERLGHGLETRLWLAAARLDEGDAEEATAVLAPVVERLEGGNSLGVVLLARAPLARLAAPAARQRLDSRTQAALARWQALAAGAAPAPGMPEAPLPGPRQDGGLSGRELEVLERIAAGDSNKLIARAFDLSPHTVKRHVANILDKLGVASRGQAAAWYRARS